MQALAHIFWILQTRHVWHVPVIVLKKGLPYRALLILYRLACIFETLLLQLAFRFIVFLCRGRPFSWIMASSFSRRGFIVFSFSGTLVLSRAVEHVFCRFICCHSLVRIMSQSCLN